MKTTANGTASPPPAANADPRRRALSPSFAPSLQRRAPAYELKFLIDEPVAIELERRLAPFLHPDPHADPALDGAYAIASLYTDTPAFDVFHRVGMHQFSKLRVRRYATSEQLFLERKTVRATQVRKRREACDPADLPRRLQASSHDWFTTRIARRSMRPVCRVSYHRRAYFGDLPDGPLRLTFDRRIRAALVVGWTFDASSEEIPLLDSLVVCEFKFRTALPATARRVIQDLALAPAGVSKYRSCLRALGVVTPGSPTDA